MVQGETQGVPHGWNLVKADGEYYYVDVTWGDFAYQSNVGSVEAPKIIYDYLLVTTEEITVDMTIDEVVPLPMCTATDDNYFVRENLMFSHMDEERLKKLFHNAAQSPYGIVTLKCEGRKCYMEME